MGYEAGLLSSSRFESVAAKASSVESELERLRQTRHEGVTLERLLRRSGMRYGDLPGADCSLPADVIDQVEIQVKYSGYLERQHQDVIKLKSLEKRVIPDSLDFESIVGLRIEARQKLCTVRPRTLGQASRISGVSPADISLLSVHVQRTQNIV